MVGHPPFYRRVRERVTNPHVGALKSRHDRRGVLVVSQGRTVRDRADAEPLNRERDRLFTSPRFGFNNGVYW